MRSIEPFAAVHVDVIGPPCATCLRWQATPAKDAGSRKRAWVEGVVERQGHVGWVVLDDGVPAGHILYAPAADVPHVLALPTGPPSDGAAVVAGLAFDDDGVGRLLLQRAARELRRRRVPALEAFGGPAGSWRCSGLGDPCESLCRIPVGALEALGFNVERPHPTVPRYRLDLGRTVTVPVGVRDLVRSLRPRPVESDPVLGRDG